MASRRFPVLSHRLSDGSLNLSTVCLLAPHLTVENHEAVLAKAMGRSKRQVEELVARIAPMADVEPSVRKLPSPALPAQAEGSAPARIEPSVPAPVPPPAAHRPQVTPLAPERHRVQFTVGTETHEKLRRVKRAVWLRDSGRCAFVAKNGHRCNERAFLEFHHVEPYGIGGETTAANLSLRCRAHNAYEAEVLFGPVDFVREPAARYATTNGPQRLDERDAMGSTRPGDSWDPTTRARSSPARAGSCRR